MAKHAARERLATLLGGEDPERSEVMALTLPGDALQVDVDGVGTLTWPVNAGQARGLIDVARPARFGHGTETLLDPSVRDTWELTAQQVTLGGPMWHKQLANAIDQVKETLGLPDEATLRPELYSMLVYGKGQFFLPHQDSEKHDEMVASLVVSLPSIHSGGELIVEDGGTPRTFAGSRTDVTLVSFYADARHEVKPVRSGWRVTLTFNLMLTTPEPETETTGGPVQEAADLLAEHFATPGTTSWGRVVGLPRRLVFLLDHEYTQRALFSDRFKGADADRVALLRAAAQGAGCETVLAQADLHEVREAHDNEYQYDYWHDDELEEEEDDAPEPSQVQGSDGLEVGEILDSETTLVWWARHDGEEIRLDVPDHELSAATSNTRLTPYESDYEGFTGNAGNTLDRWYRRAALVIEPAGQAFASRAEANPTAAMRELADRIGRSDTNRLHADAASVAPSWTHRGVDPVLFDLCAQVAGAVQDESVARILLAPFPLAALRAEHATALASVTRTYGTAWSTSLAGLWTATWPDNETPGWIAEHLGPVATCLREADTGPLADVMTAATWRWVRAGIEAWLPSEQARNRQPRLAELGSQLGHLLAVADGALGDQILTDLAAMPTTVIEVCLPALRTEALSRTALARSLAAQVLPRVTAIAERPPRASDDWSVIWTPRCSCDLCKSLADFLAAPDRQEINWARKQRERDHLESQLRQTDLPVKAVTIRSGRPYTLHLEKTAALFEHERAAQVQAAADTAWLRETYGA